METNQIDANSPCTAEVTPSDNNGGLRVTVTVPTDNGVIPITLTVERQQDGDWAIYLPSAAALDAVPLRPGTAGLGAPTDIRPAELDTRDMA
jgi:hypothetical protein